MPPYILKWRDRHGVVHEVVEVGDFQDRWLEARCGLTEGSVETEDPTTCIACVAASTKEPDVQRSKEAV